MADLIYKDTARRIIDSPRNKIQMLEVLEQTPTVEIIRCRDCRHSVDEYHDGDCYCRRPNRGYVLEWVGDWDFYCKAAERRQT